MSMTNADEWEVVNDDGFIYKRRKRDEVVPTPATLVNSQEPVLSEQALLRVREALTRRKKVAMLLAQKEIYVAEVAQWEEFLKAQEESQACTPIAESPPSLEQVSVPSMDEATSNEGLQILHLQVEAYERFIEKLRSLLDQGESMCKMLEMDLDTNNTCLGQDMFKEVVKLTPRTIIHSLTSPALPLPVANLLTKSRLGQLMGNDGYETGQAKKAE